LTVDSSKGIDDAENTVDNLTNKEKSQFSGLMDGIFEVTYAFKKPVLFRGYII
jgi:hypothetical protein